jgi:hypothetical protein
MPARKLASILFLEAKQSFAMKMIILLCKFLLIIITLQQSSDNQITKSCFQNNFLATYFYFVLTFYINKIIMLENI